MASTAFAREVAGIEPQLRLAHVEMLVMRVVHEVTGDDDVLSSSPLMEAGIDSLAATELASRLRTLSQLQLPSTLIFEQPTPRAISARILMEACGTQDAKAGQAHPGTAFKKG